MNFEEILNQLKTERELAKAEYEKRAEENADNLKNEIMACVKDMMGKTEKVEKLGIACRCSFYDQKNNFGIPYYAFKHYVHDIIIGPKEFKFYFFMYGYSTNFTKEMLNNISYRHLLCIKDAFNKVELMLDNKIAEILTEYQNETNHLLEMAQR